MRRTVLPLCAATLLVSMAIASLLSAQASGRRTKEQIKASYEAHQGDFDYLLGDWEFTSVSREFGTGRGYWSAVRLAEGAQILDEYRVVGDSGQTYYVSSTLRAYNAVLDQWELVSAESGTGLQNVGTAHRIGTEMHIEQKFGVMSPNPSIWRIRYYDIRPDAFPGRATAQRMAERPGSRSSCGSKRDASGRRGPWGRSRPRRNR